jgi:hypothetical protein
MKATFLKGVALGSAVSLMTLAATAAFAGTGVGNVFNLGESNRANARSGLEAKTPTAVLNVTNSDGSGSASGISIHVPATKPPLVVNSSTKVKNFNADLLDGQSASAFQRATSKACPLGSAISSVAPSGATACNSPVVLPLEQNVAPLAQLPPGAAFAPSTIRLGFFCQTTYEGVQIYNSGTPATLSYSYGGNGQTLSVGTHDLFGTSDWGIEDDTATQFVGQIIYIDSATLTTINFTAMNEGADGCEFEGTVTIARR